MTNCFYFKYAHFIQLANLKIFGTEKKKSNEKVNDILKVFSPVP